MAQAPPGFEYVKCYDCPNLACVPKHRPQGDPVYCAGCKGNGQTKKPARVGVWSIDYPYDSFRGPSNNTSTVPTIEIDE